MSKLSAKIITIATGIALSIGLGFTSINRTNTSVKADPTEYSVSWDLTTNSYVAGTVAVDYIEWTSSYVSVYGYRGSSGTNINAHIPTAQSETEFYKNQQLNFCAMPGYEITRMVLTLQSETAMNTLDNSTWTNIDSKTKAVSSPWTLTVVPENGKNSVPVTIKTVCAFLNITIYFLNEVDNSYNKITSTDDLYDGMPIVIGASDYSSLMYIFHDEDNRPGDPASQDEPFDAIVSSDGDNIELILGIEELSNGTIAYSFKDYLEEKYLYSDGSGSDYNLKLSSTLTDNGRFTVSISEGIATLTGLGTNENKVMRYDSGSDTFACYGSPGGSISLYAEYQNITDKQAVDTFVTKYMKMESISEENTGTTVNCASNWNAAKIAYEKLNDNQQFMFVDDSNYIGAALRFIAWAEANGYSVDEYGTLSTRGSLNIINISNSNSSITIIVIMSILSTLTIAGYFLLCRRKEQ